MRRAEWLWRAIRRLPERLAAAWQRSRVRVATAIALLLMLLVVQTIMYRQPAVLDLEAEAALEPMEARRGSERMLVDLVVGDDGALFSHDGQSSFLGDVYFDRVRLADSAVRNLRLRGIHPPPATDGSFLVDEQSSACRATVVARVVEPAEDVALTLFQRKESSAGCVVEMRASRELSLQIQGLSSPEVVGGEGCRRDLSLGDWSYTVPDPISVQFIVPAEQGFRFLFQAPADSTCSALEWATGLAHRLAVHEPAADTPRAAVLGSPEMTLAAPQLSRRGITIEVIGGSGWLERNGRLASRSVLEEILGFTPLMLLAALLIQLGVLGWVAGLFVPKKAGAD